MAQQLPSQLSLRRKQETPAIIERRSDGNLDYPLTPEGSTGRVFDYDERHEGDLPPREVVPNPGADDSNFAATAALTAAALATRQKEAAAYHQHEFEKNPRGEKAAFHLSEADRHRNVQSQYERQERMYINDPETTPLPVGNAPVIKVPEGTAPQPTTQRTQNRQAQTRTAPVRTRVAALQAAPMPAAAPIVPDNEPGRAPEYEDSTELPFYAQEMASGYPPEAPTGNDFVASAPLPPGSAGSTHNTAEGSPYAAEHAHEALGLEAHHAHLEARGVAEIAHQRAQAANARAADRRAKGLPTVNDEREAGWATQQELRARGIEQQNIIVEDGQRVREREDIGAERQAEMEKSAAKTGAERQDHANDTIDRTIERTEDLKDDMRTAQTPDVQGDMNQAAEPEPDNETIAPPAMAARPRQTPRVPQQATASAPAAATTGATETAPQPQQQESRSLDISASLPSYVQANKSEFGTSYVFITPQEARSLGFEDSILLGVDDGSGGAMAGIAEKAWALAGQVEALMKQHEQELSRQTEPSLAMPGGVAQGVFIPPDATWKLQSKPADPELLGQEMRRLDDDTYHRRQDEIAHENVEVKDSPANDDKDQFIPAALEIKPEPVTLETVAAPGALVEAEAALADQEQEARENNLKQAAALGIETPETPLDKMGPAEPKPK